MAYMELTYKNGKVISIFHTPAEKLAPSKANENGDIDSYWYSYDWDDLHKYKPKQIDAYKFGKGSNKTEIFCIKDYEVGQFYFSNPSYLSGLPYAELEEEIANYCINHIKNGLSFGHVININSGKPESEQQLHEMSRDIINKLTGSRNAGKFLLSFNDNKEVATTVEALVVSDAHEQYQFLSEEARSQICVSHKVVSGAILGINKSTGFSSNAEEIETAFNETMLNVIQPIQEVILDALYQVLGVEAEFVPLREAKKDEAQSGEDIQPIEMAKTCNHDKEINSIADALIGLGEDVDDNEWELVDERQIVGAPTLTETAFKLAKVPTSFPNVKSEQDTDLFKIRYQYAPQTNSENSREFCVKMVKANKVYRKEDIEFAGQNVVNEGFGPNGADTYNIWFYKGGVYCNHFWMRKIYLRRNNTSISVNDAKRMILELEPEQRKDNRLQENDPLVAQPAQSSNNWFKLK
jgi:hypothetical protein